MARARRRRHDDGAPRGIAGTPARTATALSPPRAWPRWAAALLISWVALVYSPGLRNGFTYDDPSVIADASRLLSDPGQVGRLFTSDYFRLSGESTYRPVVTLTYMLDWQVGGGAAWAFHLQSVCWHLVAVAGVLGLLGRFGMSDPLRFTTAGLYGVHPALTEAVDAIAFREDVLVTACGLVGLLLLTADRPTRGVRILGAAFAFAAALFSKETAIVFAALVPLTFWVMGQLRPSERADARRAEYLVVLACVAAYGVVRFGLFPAHEQYGMRVGGSLLASLATGAVAIAYYLRLLVYPITLCADYRGVIAVVTAASDWRPWLAVVVLGAGTFATWRLRRVQPLAWWGYLWFLIAIGPVSNIVPIPAFMAERFLHLPYVGLVAGAAALVALGLSRWAKARTLGTAGVILVLTCSALTAARHQVWRSNDALWETTLRDHPTAQGALHGYGSAMIERGRYADGVAYLQRLLDDPTIGDDRRAAVSIELGAAFDRLGQLDAARRYYEQAVAAAPDPRAQLGLALTYVKLGRIDDARLRLEALLKSQPDYAEAYSVLGGVLSIQGARADAVGAWREAVRLNPSDASAHANIGVALGHDGKLDEAIQELNEALSLQPQQAQWHVAIAELLAAKGDRLRAREHLEQALRINPDVPRAREVLQALVNP